MALSVNSIYECNASATANNVNGGGFNPTNAGMLTDATATSATGNAPVISSASYNFVAGDVGHWIYIQAGTNWTPGWYKISSVASNQATVDATIGAAIQANPTSGYPSPFYTVNTVAGIATTASPTAGTFTIDYSQGTTAIVNGVADFNAVGASTTLTSATAGFTPVMVGNFFHQTTTGTGAFGVAGWYEIATYVNATTVTLDRTPNSGTASVNTTGYVGGAMSLNSTLDDNFIEIVGATNGTGASRIFIKNGVFSLGESMAPSINGGSQAPIVIEGYNSLRGDSPTGDTRPTIKTAANSLLFATNWSIFNLIVNGTATNVVSLGATNQAVNCKFTNTSTTADRAALSVPNSNSIIRCEAICYRGRGIFWNSAGGDSYIFACYIHDSSVGVRVNSGGAGVMNNNILSSNAVAAIQTGAVTNGLHLQNNTLYGSENTTGIGLSLATGATFVTSRNNIYYGFVTGISHADTQAMVNSDYDTFYNNDTDVTNVQKGNSTIAVNPSFTSVSQMTGTGATSSTNVLTYGTGGFNAAVTDGVTHVYLVSGSGTGFTAGIYPISSHTDTTITLADPNGTAMNITSSGSGSSIVFQLTYGNNFLPTGSI